MTYKRRLRVSPAWTVWSAILVGCIFLFSGVARAQQSQTEGHGGSVGRNLENVTDTSRAIGSSDLARRNPRYELCASDILAISFPLTPEFNQTVTIQPDGFVTLTAVGDVRLQGLTTEQSVEAIKTAYSKVLHAPIVTIELKKFNEPYFIVGGQVRQPGKYDLRGYTTATQAVAMAGGFNNDAKHSQVLLFRRVNNDWFEVKNLNLKRILRGRDLAEDPEIRTGDMLFVPQNTISKIKRLIPAYGVGTYYQLYR
jgi:polysaccharide biosynthesis/export protein